MAVARELRLEHAFGVEQGGQSSWSGRSDGNVGDKGSNR